MTSSNNFQENASVRIFQGQALPTSPTKYVGRIMQYGEISPCCLLIGLIYLERLKEREPALSLTSKTLQRLLIVSVMEAAKFFEDCCFSNKHWYQISKTDETNYCMLFIYSTSIFFV